MAYNILLVDDSKIVRSVIAKTLTMTEIPVNKLFEAANGKEALEVLNDQWIDLVFADINMPEMNGIEMVQRMHDDGLLKTVPVIIVSTEGSKTRIEELRSKGISGYIRKPFTPEGVKELVEKIMGEDNKEGS